jgi:hypothetical protein
MPARFMPALKPVAVALCALAPALAGAAECVDRTALVDKLSSEFSEAQKAVGLANNGSVVEVFVSANGSWTMLTTAPTGESCAIAAGEDWAEARGPVLAHLDWKF